MRIIYNTTMDARATDNKADVSTWNQHFSNQMESLFHLSYEVICSMVITFEEMGTRSDFSCFHCQWIETKPIHAIFVVKPILIGIRIWW